ncbi:MAG: hypothetical protein ACK559_37315, partial [bacterium]
MQGVTLMAGERLPVFHPCRLDLIAARLPGLLLVNLRFQGLLVSLLRFRQFVVVFQNTASA